MIPIHLHLSGFLSYQEPVDLDFTSFELACISGANGAGKSSLLDAMTWALFGQARRRDDAVINSHATAAEVVFDFRYENNLYRVLRSKPREKTTLLELFICQEDAGSAPIWRPLTEKSMRETETRIRNTLRMDYETFTNASFLLQGRADQFATQGPGERKKVLTSILGLEVWEEYRADAVERRRLAEFDQKAADAQIEDIDHELAEEDARKRKLAETEAQLALASQLRAAREREMESMRRQAASVEDQRRMVGLLEKTAREARERFERLSAEHAARAQERDAFQQVLAGEAEAQAAYRRWQELRAELERYEGVAANFREIEARRAAPRTVIAAEASRLDQERRTLSIQELEVIREQARLPEIEAQAQKLDQEVQLLEAALNERDTLEAALQSTVTSAADASATNRVLKEAMRDLKDRIDRLKQVEGADCPLCGQPLGADHRGHLVTDLEAQGKEMGDQFRANIELMTQADARVSEAKARLNGLKQVGEEQRALSRQLDGLKAEHRRIESAVGAWAAGGAGRLAEVNRMLAEEDFAHAARTELAAIDEQSRALGYDAAAHDGVKQAELDGRSAEAGMRAVEAARASLAPLERQVAGLEEQLARESAVLSGADNVYQEALRRYETERDALPDVEAAEREVNHLQSEENRLRFEMGGDRQRVAVLDTLRERKKTLTAHREALSVQIARLKVLDRAFSKDGVPALLIEQALPEIEAQANNLLDRLSNGAMSVRFETQRQYKDKSRDDRRETLDIIISDGAGPREYEMFSGGEAFRVNFAIRLALSRVLAQRAGARLQTLVIDEGFGSQDAEGRQRLIEAINLVRTDFKKVLVITHMEELKDAFPARIEVEKTAHGSRVEVIS
jgi:exonuclease SbcC